MSEGSGRINIYTKVKKTLLGRVRFEVGTGDCLPAVTFVFYIEEMTQLSEAMSRGMLGQPKTLEVKVFRVFGNSYNPIGYCCLCGAWRGLLAWVILIHLANRDVTISRTRCKNFSCVDFLLECVKCISFAFSGTPFY